MSDRPKALAAVRFEQRREAFAGLSLKERFALIHETNLWGAETSRSGLGSEEDSTKAVVAGLGNILADLKIRSLLDIPCGEGLWIAALDLTGIQYTGADIVPEIVADLSARFASEPARSYVTLDLTRDPLPSCDLVLCRDCLVHLSYRNIQRAFANIKTSGCRWLLATTFTELMENQDCEDGDWRPLNLTQAPFGLPEPMGLINEQCNEAGGAYRDKCLALWRANQI